MHASRVVALAAVLVSACKPEPEGTEDDPLVVHDGMLTTSTWTTASDAEGLLDVAIEVGPDTTSFLVAPTVVDEYPVLLSLTDPDGEVVLDAAHWVGDDELLTDAFERSRKTMALNWPVRASDPPLTPGTWHALWATVDDASGSRNPDDTTYVAVLTKDDPDPTRGTVEVHLVWADGVEQGPANEAAVMGGVDLWQEQWAVYGLDVAPTFHTSSLDPTLPFTASGGPEVEAVAQEVAGPGDLVVVLGDSMIYRPGVYGTGPSTPGSPYPSPYHYVALALDMLVPSSGVVSADDRQLVATTLAHEVAHYMGLPHPVEMDWDHWDALSDTPECGTESICEQQLGTNLMFPTSQCSQSCGAPSLTLDQQAVLHLYTGTR